MTENRGAYFRSSARHQICLNCPLPDCDDSDRRCGLRKVRTPKARPDETWLTTRQVADIRGVKPDTVIKEIKLGLIPARKVDGRWWVPESAIQK